MNIIGYFDYDPALQGFTGRLCVGEWDSLVIERTAYDFDPVLPPYLVTHDDDEIGYGRLVPHPARFCSLTLVLVVAETRPRVIRGRLKPTGGLQFDLILDHLSAWPEEAG